MLQRTRGVATFWRNKGFTNIFCTTISDLFEGLHYGVMVDYVSNVNDFFLPSAKSKIVINFPGKVLGNFQSDGGLQF